MIELEILIKRNYEDYLKEHGLDIKRRHHPTYETFREIFVLGMITQQTIDKIGGEKDVET
jgi:hypothetical protein